MSSSQFLIPPPEIKNYIETTANFVSLHGPKFENTIMEKEKHNPSFFFLRATDPFHAFYQSRIKHFQSLNAQNNSSSSSSSAPSEPTPAPSNEVEQPVKEETSSNQIISSMNQPAKRGLNSLSQRMITVNRKVKSGELKVSSLPSNYVMNLPEGITALDLDVMKLTAQFVAKNGHQFQKGLWEREHKNPQFEFLKANHPLHSFFLKSLVESYVRCLNPPRDFAEKLKRDFPERNELLDRIIAKYQQQKEEEERERLEREKHEDTTMNIDWHDFVVVYTIDFQDEVAPSSLPSSDSIPTLGPQFNPMKEEGTDDVEMETDDMEMEVDEEPAPRKPSEIKVRKDYVKGATAPEPKVRFQKCPKCGSEIPVDQMQEHMRIELLDAKYKDQRAMQQERSKGAADYIAGDDEISKNLSAFARKRTDIFGDNKNIVLPTPEEKPEKVVWDGFSSSINSTTLQAQSLASNQPPVLAPPPTHLSGPILPTLGAPPALPYLGSSAIPHLTPSSSSSLPVLSQPPLSYVPPPPPTLLSPSSALPPHLVSSSSFVPPPPEDEPSSKRLKVDEQSLIPEDQFLQQNPSTYSIQIRVPEDNSKAEWKLQGQTLTIEVNGKDTISQVKERVKEQVGLPSNKQKLQNSSFPNLVDAKSVAFYNLTNQSVLELRLKARGGKK